MSFSWHCKIERTEQLIVSSIYSIWQRWHWYTQEQWSKQMNDAWLPNEQHLKMRVITEVRMVQPILLGCNHQFSCCKAEHKHDTFCHRIWILREWRTEIWKLNIKCRVISCLHSAHHLSPRKPVQHFSFWHLPAQWNENSFQIRRLTQKSDSSISSIRSFTEFRYWIQLMHIK